MSELRNKFNKSTIVRLSRIAIKRLIFPVALAVFPVHTARYQYKKRFGTYPNIKNPRTFNEKLLWLKLYWRNPQLSVCADKYEVRKYVSECGCREILNELYGVWEQSSDIDWDSLPREFVLKANNGCKRNIFCRDKNSLDKSAALKEMNRWLKDDYSLHHGEYHYSKIKPRLICEKYLHNPGTDKPVDYKLYCFRGKVKYVLTVTERSGDGLQKYHFTDMEWNSVDFIREGYFERELPTRPTSLDEMVKYAEILSKPFPYVRVDFYECDDRPVFGEMTFYPAACMWEGYTRSGEELIGSMIELPQRWK